MQHVFSLKMGILRLHVTDSHCTFLVLLHCTYEVVLLTLCMLSLTDIDWTTAFLNWAMQRIPNTYSTIRLNRLIVFLLNPQLHITTSRLYLGRIRAIATEEGGDGSWLVTELADQLLDVQTELGARLAEHVLPP
jgi:hypothetical protein